MVFFFFNDTATTEIYTLSLHDALPILGLGDIESPADLRRAKRIVLEALDDGRISIEEAERLQGVVYQSWRLHQAAVRSEEHTSELQSRQYLVCRLLLEKKKNK